MFDGHIFSVGSARPKVLIQSSENLRVENLKSANAIHHSLQLLQKRKLLNTE